MHQLQKENYDQGIQEVHAYILIVNIKMGHAVTVIQQIKKEGLENSNE
jgi:hypothetical protein